MKNKMNKKIKISPKLVLGVIVGVAAVIAMAMVLNTSNVGTQGLIKLNNQESLKRSFADVPTSYEYADAIKWFYEEEVVKGYADGTFRPDQEVSRAEFLKMLYEVEGGIVYPDTDKNRFDDVKAKQWYTKYVNKALEDNIIAGYDDGMFRPNNVINRAEAVTIVMTKFFEGQPKEFFDEVTGEGGIMLNMCEGGMDSTDVTEGAWFEPSFFYAEYRCLIPNEMRINDVEKSEVFISPAKLLTRGEMAEILYRTKALLDNKTTLYDKTLVPKSIVPGSQSNKSEGVTDCGEDYFCIVYNANKCGQATGTLEFFAKLKVNIVDANNNCIFEYTNLTDWGNEYVEVYGKTFECTVAKTDLIEYEVSAPMQSEGSCSGPYLDAMAQLENTMTLYEGVTTKSDDGIKILLKSVDYGEKTAIIQVGDFYRVFKKNQTEELGGLTVTLIDVVKEDNDQMGATMRIE